MKKKLNCVLLIDDDDATNYIHEYLLKKMNCAEQLCIEYHAEEALNKLRNKSLPEGENPELILLDLNIPSMNGWEFLQEFQKLENHKESKIIILTTSLNPDDRKKAAAINEVIDFKNKPLTMDLLQEILNEHFPEHV